MTAAIREEGERTRRHFDVVVERIEARVALIAEGHTALAARIEVVRDELKADIAGHDKRITRLEADRLKRR